MTDITLTSLEYEEICDSISTIPEEYELDAQSEDRKLDSFEENVCEAIREFQKHKAKDGIVVVNGLTTDQLFEIYDAVSCWPSQILGEVERQGYISQSNMIFCQAIQKLFQSAGRKYRQHNSKIFKQLSTYPIKEEN